MDETPFPLLPANIYWARSIQTRVTTSSSSSLPFLLLPPSRKKLLSREILLSEQGNFLRTFLLSWTFLSAHLRQVNWLNENNKQGSELWRKSS